MMSLLTIQSSGATLVLTLLAIAFTLVAAISLLGVFVNYARNEILDPLHPSSNHRHSLGVRGPDPDDDAGVHRAEVMFVQHGGHERRVRVTGA
jgi:hypothetical protein